MKKYVCWTWSGNGVKANKVLLKASNLREALVLYGIWYATKCNLTLDYAINYSYDGLEYRLCHCDVDFDLTK